MSRVQSKIQFPPETLQAQAWDGTSPKTKPSRCIEGDRRQTVFSFPAGAEWQPVKALALRPDDPQGKKTIKQQLIEIIGLTHGEHSTGFHSGCPVTNCYHYNLKNFILDEFASPHLRAVMDTEPTDILLTKEAERRKKVKTVKVGEPRFFPRLIPTIQTQQDALEFLAFFGPRLKKQLQKYDIKTHGIKTEPKNIKHISTIIERLIEAQNMLKDCVVKITNEGKLTVS